ncbi:MAG TPA: 30S ribosomal protein S16 [Gammaproteobacteria bacterium]|nr:30S ribosomal protein S16 [Gammaproteobacteria bacterium]
MLTIRLARQGRKKVPFYHMVVADKRSPRDSNYIEKVGHYNPLNHGEPTRLVLERITHWLTQGAHPSARVKNIIKQYTKAANQSDKKKTEA